MSILSPTGTELYLPFSEGSGSTAYDYSGNANNGTITGATYAKIKDGGYALNFDGSGDMVNCGNASFLSDTSGTIIMWVEQTASNNFFGAADFNTANRFFYAVHDIVNHLLRLIHYDSAYNYDIRTPTDSYPANEPVHVAITSDGSTIKIYLNGEEQALTVAGGSNNGDWFGDLTGVDVFSLGAVYYNSGVISNPLTGTLRLPIVTSDTKSAEFIKKHYQETFIQ